MIVKGYIKMSDKSLLAVIKDEHDKRHDYGQSEVEKQTRARRNDMFSSHKNSA